MLRNWFSRLQSIVRTPARRHSPWKRPARRRVGRYISPLACEVLEDRTLLSSITVNSTADLPVDLTDGDVTLRDAIFAANNDAAVSPGGPTGNGADTIVFDDTVFNASSDPITLGGTQLPAITEQLTIDGSIDGGAARVVVDGDNASRIFTIASGVQVDLQNLVLQNGNSGIADGGGIFNRGTLTITNSTLWGNSADDGGGIFNNRGTLTITNSTLSGNTALGGVGGGIFNSSTGTVDITASTLSGNTALDGGGGIFNHGTVNIDNTIVAGNTGPSAAPDASGTFNSAGLNLIGDGSASTGFIDGVDSDQVGTSGSPIDPKLGPLQDNGGPTFTHALLPGSPAIDAGATDLTTDQRGLPRPIGLDPDIGAFEAITDISGWWIIDGQAAQILQLNGAVTFINEHNVVSEGSFNSSLQVVAKGWGDLVGDIVGDEIRWANGSVWARIPTLSTTAVIDGSSPVLVQQSGIDLRFTNERGEMSGGRFVNSTAIVAADWGNLMATIAGDEIQWDNGTVWTGVDLSTSVPVILAGAWSLGGQNTTILQFRNDLLFINEHGSVAAGVVVDQTQVVATGWGNLSGTIDAATRRILWDNGTAWDRVPVLNRNENWHIDQRPTAVSQLGTRFLFTNEFGDRSEGGFDPLFGVIATDWPPAGGLCGQIDFDDGQIEWNNLSVWRNSQFGINDEVFADVNNWPWLD